MKRDGLPSRRELALRGSKGDKLTSGPLWDGLSSRRELALRVSKGDKLTTGFIFNRQPESKKDQKMA
jgi:hypothetical protein